MSRTEQLTNCPCCGGGGGNCCPPCTPESVTLNISGFVNVEIECYLPLLFRSNQKRTGMLSGFNGTYELRRPSPVCNELLLPPWGVALGTHKDPNDRGKLIGRKFTTLVLGFGQPDYVVKTEWYVYAICANVSCSGRTVSGNAYNYQQVFTTFIQGPEAGLVVYQDFYPQPPGSRGGGFHRMNTSLPPAVGEANCLSPSAFCEGRRPVGANVNNVPQDLNWFGQCHTADGKPFCSPPTATNNCREVEELNGEVVCSLQYACL